MHLSLCELRPGAGFGLKCCIYQLGDARGHGLRCAVVTPAAARVAGCKGQMLQTNQAMCQCRWLPIWMTVLSDAHLRSAASSSATICRGALGKACCRLHDTNAWAPAAQPCSSMCVGC